MPAKYFFVGYPSEELLQREPEALNRSTSRDAPLPGQRLPGIDILSQGSGRLSWAREQDDKGQPENGI
jgi:hypothetical protein